MRDPQINIKGSIVKVNIDLGLSQVVWVSTWF